MQHNLTNTTAETINRRMKFALIVVTMVAGSMIMTSTPAEAQLATNSPMGWVICGLLSYIYGNLGRGLAALAVIILGIGALIGKVSWGLAMTVAVGIATIFGGAPIAAFLIAAASSSDGVGAICGGPFGF